MGDLVLVYLTYLTEPGSADVSLSPASLSNFSLTELPSRSRLSRTLLLGDLDCSLFLAAKLALRKLTLLLDREHLRLVFLLLLTAADFCLDLSLLLDLDLLLLLWGYTLLLLTILLDLLLTGSFNFSFFLISLSCLW